MSSSSSSVPITTVMMITTMMAALICIGSAFSFSSLPLTQRNIHSRHHHSRPVLSTTRLHMSDGADDELSKLIGKRKAIKREKKEGLEEIEEKLMQSMEPTVDLDLDKLPEFKTERVARRAESTSSNDNDSDDEKDKDAKKDADAPIVDYLADYEDENDWHIPNRIGVTGAAWGDTTQGFVTSGKLSKRMLKAGKFVAGDVQLAVTKLLEGGITMIETSPSYGSALKNSKLSSEHILRQCLKEVDSTLPEPMVVENLGGGSVAWKAVVSPSNTMVSTLEDSLNRLGGESAVEVFMAPRGPVPYTPTRLLAAGLAAQIESGQTNYVGVSGLTSASALRRLCNHLDARDCILTACSFPLSLTQTKNEAMIDACKEANVVPLITDPLDGGLASGVFTATNPSGGMSGVAKARYSFKQLEKLQPLHSVQETVAERVRTRVMRGMRDTQDRFKSKYGPPPKINTDITTTQVALNWVIAKGGVPLAEVNSPAQAEQVLGCLGWTLTDEEVDMIDSAIALCKL